MSVFSICIKRCHARCPSFSYVFNIWIKMASTSGSNSVMELLRNRPSCPAESGGVTPSVPTVQRLWTELSRAAWSCSLPLTAISDCQPVCELWESHQWLSACVRALAVASVTVSLCAGFGVMHTSPVHVFCCSCMHMFIAITRLPEIYLLVYFRHGKPFQDCQKRKRIRKKKRCRSNFTSCNESILYNELAKTCTPYWPSWTFWWAFMFQHETYWWKGHWWCGELPQQLL